MTDKLPPNLLALFAPRPPLRWVPPADLAPEERTTAYTGGVADFLPALAQYEREYDYKPTESWLERRDRKKLEKEAAVKKLLTEGPKKFNPNEDPNIRGDAFKTLIVARLDYSADEHDLEREFSRFGPIERIRLIKDTHAHQKGNKKRKPHRGYAFVVFEREKDMRARMAHVRYLAALQGCDGLRIKDRRIKVDVERGRTVKDWVPRRLGGGLGGRHYTKAMPSRPMGPGGFGGGFRGGFGGGFGGRDGGFRGGRGGFRGGDRFGDRGDRPSFRGGRGFGGGDQKFGSDFNGQAAAPANAPNGPGGGFGGRDFRRDGPGSDRGSGYSRDGGGGRSYDDKSGGGFRGSDRNPRQSGSNMEPIRPREPRESRDSRDSRDNGGYHGGGRDYDRPPRDDRDRKRGYEGGYEDPRKLRRY
ncbi:U1 small nuclear ribonucleoprotein 70 kDa [Apodospora peruviana]|uniref:U1 small nuclear ribonucleoprotein 70 kDa n=1 Tax=Apodospora peruviana TaxID=516989 RepID=A0AAE0IBX8_9PEZI|nr:U1 small nuclear ribonucleoprotein 70 kDa [Apodospora peruviana]